MATGVVPSPARADTLQPTDTPSMNLHPNRTRVWLATAATLAVLTQARAPAHAQSVALTAPNHPPVTLDLQQLEALPQSESAHPGGRPLTDHQYRGPLLWTVLATAHLLDPARHADIVRQTLRIGGSDGYVAILAMGELAPDFENKPAILALTEDGKPLPRPHAIIPGDSRGGRSVRDVVTLTLDELPKP